MLRSPEVSLARFKILECAPLVAALVVFGMWSPQADAQSKGLNPALPLVHSDSEPNTAAAQSGHYVVLVLLEGLRWDYAKRDNATHLLSLAKEGAWAPDGMLPSYPAVNFANGYTIATGLYPGHHGIVADEFHDPEKKTSFSTEDREAVADGSWYGGTPLWSLAEKSGMRTACIFWSGCEAEIMGYRPAWYAESNGKSKPTPALDQAGVDDALALLRLAPDERPHLIMISFSEPEAEAERFGPDATQTRAAVLRIDAVIGKLKTALEKTGLPVNLVVVSGNGLVAPQGNWLALDQLADLKGFSTKGNLLYADTEQDRVRLYNLLKKASSQFILFRRKNVPAELNYNQSSRVGDPVFIATGPYAIRARSPAAGQNDQPPSAGLSGFDPRRVPEMKAGFFAAGPDIVKGKTVAPFENVNLYPWLAHILGLVPAKNDGALNILAGTLRDGGNVPDDSPAQ